MEVRGLIIFATIFSSFVASCYGDVSFSKLPNTISVNVTIPPFKDNLKAGEDNLTVSWRLSKTTTETSAYKKVEVKLCYTKESQKDRPWRKTVDDLARDKTCQHSIKKKDYNSSTDSVTYKVKKEVPTAHYFVRVYVRDGPDGKQVAYGENKVVQVNITGITGRSSSIDIAASIFSTFSVVSLGFFFYMEKQKAKREEARHSAQRT